MTAPAGAPAIDDAALVVRLRLRDPEALAILYWRYASALLRTASAITASTEDAEDVVHDVFLGLPDALGKYEEQGQLLAWLKRITARRALTCLRKHKRSPQLAKMHDTPLPPGTSLAMIAFREAFDALPDDLRVIVALRGIDGYSHAEIATLLGIRRGTSEVRLHRALKRLRNTLEVL